MANYHIGLTKDGWIQVGTKTKTGKWSNTTDVTEECLCAVRDHLLIRTQVEDKPINYGWTYPNGKTLLLQIVEKDTEELKE